MNTVRLVRDADREADLAVRPLRQSHGNDISDRFLVFFESLGLGSVSRIAYVPFHPNALSLTFSFISSA